MTSQHDGVEWIQPTPAQLQHIPSRELCCMAEVAAAAVATIKAELCYREGAAAVDEDAVFQHCRAALRQTSCCFCCCCCCCCRSRCMTVIITTNQIRNDQLKRRHNNLYIRTLHDHYTLHIAQMCELNKLSYATLEHVMLCYSAF